ncbi:MAG: DNA-binding MarR family transcriptional regulator [Bermanella sp.]
MSITVGINRPAQLARNLGVSRQAIHQLLQGMKEDGVLELAPDPSDKRAKVVQFSAASEGIRKAAESAISAIENELAERIGKQVFENLKMALRIDWGELVTAAPDV